MERIDTYWLAFTGMKSLIWEVKGAPLYLVGTHRFPLFIWLATTGVKVLIFIESPV